MVSIGDKVRIIEMVGEPTYSGRVGYVTSVDSRGQIHGTWGGLAILPGEDSYEIIEKAK